MHKPFLSRANLLKAGDLGFLIVVGIASTLTMHAIHELNWSFALACIVGMAAAMAVQMVLAFCVAPVLGSIEGMTPSMVVGMISPMSVCTLHLFGHEPTHGVTLVVGAVFGAGMFAFVEYYGARVKRRLGGISSVQ